MGRVVGDGGMGMTKEGGEPTADTAPLLPWYAVGSVAILCALVLAAASLFGPLGTDTIHYRTSQSTLWQIEGADFVNLFVIVPILVIGGVLQFLRRVGSKYFLILTPITLMYTGFSVGIGQEWGNPAYTGNSEQYSWLFMIMVTGGLILLIATLSMFQGTDAPRFNRRGLRIFVGVMCLFLAMFAFMWLSELQQVISEGDTATGGYSEAPVVWWTIRFLDLCISIPLGYLSLFLLLSKPERAYPLVLLFFGFFVTLGTAVLAMGISMTMSNDPQAQPGSLVVFGGLAALSWCGLLYLVKDRLPKLGRK